MKYLLFTCLLFAALMPVLGQTLPVDKETGLITYKDVVKVDSASQMQLYGVAKMWVLNVYGSGKYATQWMLNDHDGSIMLRSHVTTGYGFIYYTLSIECKDGRYKYTFTNFIQQCGDNDNCPGCGGLEQETCACLCLNMLANEKKVWANYKSVTNDNITSLVADMKKYIAQNVRYPKSNW